MVWDGNPYVCQDCAAQLVAKGHQRPGLPKEPLCQDCYGKAHKARYPDMPIPTDTRKVTT